MCIYIYIYIYTSIRDESLTTCMQSTCALRPPAAGPLSCIFSDCRLAGRWLAGWLLAGWLAGGLAGLSRPFFGSWWRHFLTIGILWSVIGALRWPRGGFWSIFGFVLEPILEYIGCT